MKTIKFFAVILISLTVTISTGQNNSKTSSLNQSVLKMEVIAFYGTHRCKTCKAIEANTKYTVDTYFANEQKKGIIVFKTINVDEDKNYKIAEQYEATGTALFFNIIKDGKETHVDLTDFAFLKGNDKEAFSKELKGKIESNLSTL